ncbi:MAG: hypothetical protein ACFFBT_17275, partial [Promethearchaeota archaeon]
MLSIVVLCFNRRLLVQFGDVIRLFTIFTTSVGLLFKIGELHVSAIMCGMKLRIISYACTFS